MELKIQRREVRDYLQRMQSVAQLKNEQDNSNRFGWAWMKNYNHFVSIEQANIKFQTPEQTPDLKKYADEYREKQKDFEIQYKANITANKGQYPPEIKTEWDVIESEIGKNHPTAMEQIFAHEKKMNEYLNQEVVVEIYLVAKPYHPLMTGQQLKLVEFMLSESDIVTSSLSVVKE